MTWKMDELGEPYFDPLETGRAGKMIPVQGRGYQFGFEWDGDGCHEYGGGWSMQDEIRLDHLRRGRSVLTIPRALVLAPRRTNAGDEYLEARYDNALHDCKKRANKYAESNAATMRSLFGDINRMREKPEAAE